MSDLFETIKSRIKNMPTEPGCYLMKDKQGRIFYIGKALNLQKRIKSYFTGQDKRVFVSWLKTILADIETIVVRNNTEALILEHTLIQEYKPRFNILLKDGKNFIQLRLNTKKVSNNALKHARYPRLEVVRQSKKDGARYFGPYPSATQLRETLHLINKHFQLRTCSDKIIDSRKRPCIQYQIGRCPAPCVKEIPEYRSEIENVIDFLLGHTSTIEKRLRQRMWHAAQNENYELAAQIRDQLAAIQISLTSQAVQVAGKNTNQDVFATARKGPLFIIVQLFVRNGRVTKTNHFTFDQQEFPTKELFLSFLTQLYESTEDNQLPTQVLTSIPLGKEVNILEKITFKYPFKGKAKSLVEIAQKNANQLLEENLKNKELKKNSLLALQKLLDLKMIPKVIECFDVSLFQGTDAVGSQICFIDGEPDKSKYKKYNIKTVEGINDFAMLHEVLKRRLKKGLEENNLPDLLLVDGGKGQLAVAMKVCEDLGIALDPKKFYLSAIAKARTQHANFHKDTTVPIETRESFSEIKHSYERLFIPNVKEPIILKSHSTERYLIERIRDEAHRFAITTHRSKRKKRTLSSQLEHIPGIGQKRRLLLIKHLGSLEAIAQKSPEQIQQIPGFNQQLALNIYNFLHKK